MGCCGNKEEVDESVNKKTKEKEKIKFNKISTKKEENKEKNSLVKLKDKKEKEKIENKDISTIKKNEENKEKNLVAKLKDEKESSENKGICILKKEIEKNENNDSSISQMKKENEITNNNISFCKKEEEIISNKNILPEENVNINKNSSTIKNEILTKKSSSKSNEHNLENINHFLYLKEHPLMKYNFFNISFNICHYLFIVPEKYSLLFSSFYSKILNNSLIFFPKDFHQAKELLNNIENEVGIKDNWIIISPCVELEKIIQEFSENKNIYFFIGYCYNSNHEHNYKHLYKFKQFYKIVESCDDILKTLFKLNNIYYYRKKQNYELENDENNIMELKYTNKFLFEYNNDCSKNYVIDEKYIELNVFKIRDNECYFGVILLLTLLNKTLQINDLNQLLNLVGNLPNLVIISNDILEQNVICGLFLKNLFILYLYFSNYPYIYWILSDEKIIEILSIFKSDMSEKTSKVIFCICFNALISQLDNLASKIEKGMNILNENEKENLAELQYNLIKFICAIDHLLNLVNIEELSKFYQAKNYLRDIDFLLGITILYMLNNFCKNYPFNLEFKIPFIYKEQRIDFYKLYGSIIKCPNYENNSQLKEYRKAITYNDTIVLGNKNFHDIIKKINLPVKPIYYLNDNEFYTFFLNIQKIDNKYNISKYIIIMDEKNGKEFFETIRYISNVFGLSLISIIYIQNKNFKINKNILQNPFIQIILTYSEKDILNFYEDNIFRIKETIINTLDENERLIQSKPQLKIIFPKLNGVKLFKEEDHGWDMVKDFQSNIFDLVSIHRIFGSINIGTFIKDMYLVYKENNCLDLFIKYYGNYFSGDYLIESNTSSIAVVKKFLYAYTLEEKNKEKSFYILINNDLRSGNPEKIGRYLPIFSQIYTLIKKNYLASYSGEVYRATFFSNELIKEIKPGKKLLNASLWSSSKKLSVAKKFLFKYKKNVLLHTNIKKGNNVDIHLEKLSAYPKEEEILFLPYCVFEIKKFKKMEENGVEYYDLELIYCEEENKNNKLKNIKSEDVTLNIIMK